MSDPALVVVCVLAALALGALGAFCLHGALVLGGSWAGWLESHSWVYAAAFGAGCALLVVALVFTLWPLATLGGAVAVFATARYFWLNV